MTDLPRKAFVRSARLAALPLGMAGRAAIGAGRRAAGRPAELVAAEMQARTAQQMFQVLGGLKGGAMKFGQSLSMFESALPEDLTAPYRATLTQLQEAAPPMPPRQVRAVLAEELGPQWRRRFSEFDDEPIAAASIGQVHRGVWKKDGRPVAVKVQYPGAGDALLSDLRQISRVAKVSAGWIPGLELQPILDELQGRMAEELDYLLEASSQEQMAEAYDGDDDVLVPKVVAVTQKVIVSEWVDGTPLARIIDEGTPEQRDLASMRYLELLIGSPDRSGLLHADPHPGNFRLLDDGRLGVLDLGAVNRLPLGLPEAVGQMLTLAMRGEAEELLEVMRDEGFVRASIDVDPQRLLDYLRPFVEPLATDEFTFSRAWLQEVFTLLNDPRGPAFEIGLRLNLPAQYLLIHRAWVGGIAVLCQIGGTVPVRAVVDSCVPGADLPPVGD